jgi:hypothetical protein
MCCERHTRSSREDSRALPSHGGPISLAIVGFVGSCTSTTITPAWLALAFLPRPSSELLPTSENEPGVAASRSMNALMPVCELPTCRYTSPGR